MNSLKDRENQFYRMGSKSVHFGVIALFRGMFINKFPKIANFLSIKFFDADQAEFYRSLVLDTMKQRTVHGIVRPDMIQLLMEAKRGSLKIDESDAQASDGFAAVNESKENSSLGNAKQVWSDEEYTAQCFLFFLAGYETSSNLMCVAIHELAENQEVQVKLLDEIDEVRKRLDGQPLTYEILQSMQYLDMVVSGMKLYLKQNQ